MFAAPANATGNHKYDNDAEATHEATCDTEKHLVKLVVKVKNIVWGTDDNIVWGTDDNIVWGTDDNIVWGTRLVWSNRIIGKRTSDDNIVWGTDDNIVWGTLDLDNIVWGTWLLDDNIVWGTATALLGAL